MDTEYLDGIRVKYNTDKYTVVEITTNKNTYRTKLPFTKKRQYNNKNTLAYPISVKDWCRLRKIIVKDYFGFKHQELINS